jgi:hypothetical protein
MDRSGEPKLIATRTPPASGRQRGPERGLRLLPRLRALGAWRDGDSVEGLVALALLGGLSELFLLILLERFPLTKWFPSAPTSLGFPQQMSGSWSADARWITLVMAAPFLAYVPALFYVRSLRGRLAGAIVVLWGVVFGITLLNLYPITAADVFHYLADARTLWVYHANPMLTPPAAHPFVIGISWAEQPSPYGSLWQLLAVIPVALTGDHWVASLIGFKAMGLVSVLVCSAFIYLIVRRSLPGRQNFALLLFLWNPFVVFRAVGNGHNDLTMMAFALAGFYCVQLRRWRWALPLLALSVCIKYSTALIVPPVLLYGWASSDRSERRELAVGAAIAAVTAIVVFAPFWRGFDTFKTFVQNTNLHISALPEWFAIWLQPHYSQSQAESIAKNGGYLLFAAAYLAMLYRLWRRPSFSRLVAVCALTFIAYLALCTWWFRPWYFLWFIPLAALLPDGWWPWVIVGTALGSTFFDIVEQYRVHSSWLMATDFRAYGAPVFFAFVPLLLLLLLGALVCRSWTLARADAPCHDALVEP